MAHGIVYTHEYDMKISNAKRNTSIALEKKRGIEKEREKQSVDRT